ncbi:sigma factor [Actinomadura macra]|nr:sigma factor [Actinomadura macra]
MADRAGFTDYVEEHSDRLLRTAYLLTRDWARAEDLLQTALAGIYDRAT